MAFEQAPPVDEVIEALRSAPLDQDADGRAFIPSAGVDPTRPVGKGNPPRLRRRGKVAPRPTAMEVERRIAEAQLWIAQRMPLLRIYENAGASWGVTNTRTVRSYLDAARQRMVEDLISNRLEHQAQHIYALYDCARRAMDAEQFSAAVGAFRVIAEIGGILRAPIKPPEAKT
jgi:hypothetical protein